MMELKATSKKKKARPEHGEPLLTSATNSPKEKAPSTEMDLNDEDDELAALEAGMDWRHKYATGILKRQKKKKKKKKGI